MIFKIYTATTMNLSDITSPRWGYLIRFDQILGLVGILTKDSSEKSNAPHMPRVPPPPASGLTLIDA